MNPQPAGHSEHHDHASEHHDHASGGTSAPPSPATVGAAWDQRYAEHQWPTEPDAALVEMATDLPPGRALDLGCGPGRNAIWLAGRGWTVTGVDASPVGLAQAHDRASAAGVALHLITADLLTYHPPEAAFDLVVVANMHFDPSERQRIFTGAANAVAPGGHLLVIGHHLDSLGRAGPPFPERLFTEALLAQLVPTLVIERLQRTERVTVDGEPPIFDAVLWATAPVAGHDTR